MGCRSAGRSGTAYSRAVPEGFDKASDKIGIKD